MIKKALKPIILKSIIILLAGILGGTLLLTLAYCIPVNMNSYYSTQKSIELEGWYPNVPIVTNTYNTYFQTFLPGVLDNNTVRNYMLPMTYEQGDKPLLLAMSCRGYSYYWHGYVIILRCLQLILNYEEIQLLNDFCQIALIMFLAVLIGRKKGMRYVIMLISSYVLIMPMAVAVCIQYSSVFYIAYGACLLVLCKHNWLDQKLRYFYFFIITGMLTSYFDLLTYPLFTWGIPIVWYIVMEPDTIPVLKSLKKVIISGVAWILGYGTMWVGKWVLATLILKENIIVSALGEVLLRSGTDSEVTFGQTNRLYSIYLNWKHYNYKLYVLILLGWLMFWLLRGVINGWKKSPKCPSFFLIGCSSFVWYIVLFNHTGIHHAFTYRILGICISAFFAIVIESTYTTSPKWSGLRHRLAFFALNFVLLVSSCILTLFTKEITQIDNKDKSFEKIVWDGNPIVVSFTPTYDQIYAIGFGLQTNSSTGNYDFSVYHDEEMLYRENVPVSYYMDGNYRDINVDWTLKAGTEYLLTIDVRNTNDEVYLYYTANNDLPLEGCRYYNDDALISRQPLIGFQYWCLPLSAKVRFLLTLSYWGLLLVTFHAGRCIFDSAISVDSKHS